MEQVRCTNCGSTALIPDNTGEFYKCEACGSTFNVPKAAAFSKVQLDHTQDVRAWREYLAKQLKIQQDSNKARDYGGVKLFAQKILSVLPDDFCAQYYVALADRYMSNDSAFTDFLENASLDGVTQDERREVAASVVATVEPKYIDSVKAFIARMYPDSYAGFDAVIDRNIKAYIQKLRYAKVTDRDVFICHRTAAPDQDIADAICTRLEERGLRCWIAPRNILAGSQNYEHDIIKGVQNCRVFLLVSSFKSIYSEDCETELKAAVLEGKALYSYRIDDTPYDGVFERALSAVQWLDAQDDPYAHLEQLVIDIRGLLAKDEREKAELEERRLAAREKERVQAEQRRANEQERLERLERIVTGGVAATAPQQSHALSSRLKRAEVEIQAQNFDRAETIIDEVLDEDPECGQAWWLSILCDYKCTGDRALLDSGRDFTAHRYYGNAVRFSDDEPVFARRLDAVTTEFQNKAVRAISDRLDDAQLQFESENYRAMTDALSQVDDAFGDPGSLLFTKFPDLASRYYWLKLWGKYGQNERVCVEDITREPEYEKALRYALPAQAREYEKARDTVSRNAQLFLRERSKNTANDGKLVDYLVDNKNILPIDVYNYYSSMMYYRRMLSNLHMTEAQLRSSTVDISTNEYFMLAQSVATDDQRLEYDELLSSLERNRENKRNRENAERERAERQQAREEHSKTVKSLTKHILLYVLCGLSYLFVAICVGILINDRSVSDNTLTMAIMSVLFRLGGDIVALLLKDKHVLVFTGLNMASSVITIMGFYAIWALDIEVSGIFYVLGIAALVLEGVKLSKNRKDLRRK